MASSVKFHRRGGDSFDRFNDILCAKLLSYLELDDRFRCECVNRRFNRCLYRGVTELELTPFSGNAAIRKWTRVSGVTKTVLFESVIKRCHFVCAITLVDISDQTVNAMLAKGWRLKSIRLTGYEWEISGKSWQLLGIVCGISLESISFDYTFKRNVNANCFQALLRLTPNVTELNGMDVNDCLLLDVDRHQFLPKLRSITVDSNRFSNFAAFADQYSNRLENIGLTYGDKNRFRVVQKSVDTNPSRASNQNNCFVNNMMAQLSRFKSLQTLSITWFENCADSVINNGLNLLAKNCRQLRELTLGFTAFNTRLFLANKCAFNVLNRLTIRIEDKSAFDNNFQCLKCCPNLTHLDVETDYLDREICEDIHKYAPNLKAIKLWSISLISDSTLLFLSRLEKLVSVNVNSLEGIRDVYGLDHIVKNCVHARRIDLTRVARLNRSALDMFVGRAQLNTKRVYRLRANVLRESIPREELRDFIRRSPKNVLFNFSFPTILIRNSNY